MCVVTKRLRLESRRFRYKVALYLSYLHIKFDEEITGNTFEFQACVPLPIRLCPKLNWRLGLVLFAARLNRTNLQPSVIHVSVGGCTVKQAIYRCYQIN